MLLYLIIVIKQILCTLYRIDSFQYFYISTLYRVIVIRRQTLFPGYHADEKDITAITEKKHIRSSTLLIRDSRHSLFSRYPTIQSRLWQTLRNSVARIGLQKKNRNFMKRQRAPLASFILYPGPSRRPWHSIVPGETARIHSR